MKHYLMDLLSEGKLKEVFAEIKKIADTQSSYFTDPLVLLQSRFNRNERENERGLISSNDYKIERSRIENSVKSLLDSEFDESQAPAPLKLEKSKNTEGSKSSSTTKPKVYFSYAWGDEKETGESREKIVQELYESLKADGFNVVKDKEDISYTDSVLDFMKNIETADFIVIVISDKYFLSEYNMFELYNIFQKIKTDKEKYKNKIIPIKVENINLSDPKVLDRYFDAWHIKIEDWISFMKEKGTSISNDTFNKYTRIRSIVSELGELLEFINDLNVKNKVEVSKNNFEEIKKIIRLREKTSGIKQEIPKIATKKDVVIEINLSPLLNLQINSFRKKYEEKYGEGHWLLACYASVPMLITADLLHKIRFNFREYTDTLTGEKREINPVAVSDILLSNIVEERSTDVFEYPPQLRTFFLTVLKERFGEEANGKIQALATFVLDYVDSTYTENDYEEPMREMQQLNALAFAEPAMSNNLLITTLSDAVGENYRARQGRVLHLLDSLEEQSHIRNLNPAEQRAFEVTQQYGQGIKAYQKGDETTALEKIQTLPDVKIRRKKSLNTEGVDINLPISIMDKLDYENEENSSYIALQRIRDIKEKRSTHLDLSNCELTELPNELLELTWLESLDCSKNQGISDLNSLKYLSNLNHLNLSETKVSDLYVLKNLMNLKQLYVHHTLINDLNPLKDLQNLQTLDLWETEIKDISPLKDLVKLQRLDISHTKVADLLPLKDLNNLVMLDFNSTAVTDISAIKALIKKGIPIKVDKMSSFNEKGIFLENCQLINPPFEIVELGNTQILEYFDQAKESGSVSLLEARMIIVGEAGSGKTTLLHKLIDPKFDYIKNSMSQTHGINIKSFTIKNPELGKETLLVNVWDFGGQELQHMTHQFFITPNSLFVIVMDARSESPNLSYWFKIISLLGTNHDYPDNKAKVLLVLNRKNDIHRRIPQFQDILKYYQDYLDVQFLEADFAVNDYRFENLQKAIHQSLVTLPIVKSQLPRLWKTVREILRGEAKVENYITTKRFSEICSKQGIIEEVDQLLLSGYLHQLGSLLHFQNDKVLRRLLILSPEWAVDGVYAFLTEEIIAQNNGRFTEIDFMNLLTHQNYTHVDADVILHLMTKNNFDICYEITQGNYIAVQFLPDNAPKYNWYPKDVLQFRYQYPIMPNGLMSRIIVRLSDDIETNKATNEQIVWKKGVVLYFRLKEGDCRVRLREDDAESKSGLRQILIDVVGEPKARKYALFRVRSSIEDLHKKWFRNIKADEIVPCCCTECLNSDTPQLYRVENLLKRRIKRPDVSCDISGEDIMIQQLLEGVYDRNEITDMDNHSRY